MASIAASLSPVFGIPFAISTSFTLPFSSIKLRRMLGFSDDETSNWTWNQNDVIPGSSIEKPEPLFKKLDEVVIETEDAKLRA